MLRILKFFIPLALLACGVLFIFVFEFYLKDRVNTIPVVVAASNISFKEPLTTENLIVTHIKREQVVQDAFVHESRLSDLLGQIASIDITKGTQLYPALIDMYDLVPNYEEGEFIAPIPNDWIYAVPGSLRRSYVADFYLVAPLLDQTSVQTNFSEEETTTSPPSPPALNEWDEAIPILEDIKVIYTKDSSNREVQTLQDTELDGTGNISNLEIIANENILKQLKFYANQGYSFYITYKY